MTAIILKKHDLIFVHIPKTAGISITKWLIDSSDASDIIANNEFHPPFIDHSNLPDLLQKYGNVKNSFAVVRNPWDRIVSIFFFIKSEFYKNKIGPYLRHGNMSGEHYIHDLTWDEFIDRIEDYGNETTGYWFKPSTNQVDWIPNGVTYLLKLETLDEDIKQIGNLINYNEPLEKLNISIHNHYSDYYNDDQKKKIAKVFEKDIDTFKYSFGG